MVRLITIATMAAGAALFALYLTRADLLAILQPLIVALSIMAAALLVRLNRGMPTLDWKSLESSERKVLTGKIVELTREYLIVLSVLALTLAVLLVIQLPATAKLQLPPTSTEKPLALLTLLGIAGALVGLAVARMAYIVWRDYDVVRLQKKLIDDSADRDAVAKASEEALTKVATIRSSGLRGGPKPEVKAWNE